jgi:uncharacterized membrane protein YfcA
MYILLFIFVGLFSGIMAGIVGSGGQVVMMPLLLLCGLNYNESIAINLAVNAVPQTVPGLYLYYKKGQFKYKESIAVIIGSTFGIFIGAYVVTKNNLSQKFLIRILSLSMIILGYIIWYIWG